MTYVIELYKNHINSNIIPVTNIETSLTRLENVRNAPNLITGCAEVQTQVSKIPKFPLFLYYSFVLKGSLPLFFRAQIFEGI